MKSLVRRNVIVDLDVGRVPDVGVTAGVLCELLDDLPVVISLELVTVSPEIESHSNICMKASFTCPFKV